MQAPETVEALDDRGVINDGTLLHGGAFLGRELALGVISCCLFTLLYSAHRALSLNMPDAVVSH